MSAIYLMEWNSKTPLPWEWEHMVMGNSKSAEAPKTLRTNDWGIGTEDLADAGPLNASGYGSGSSCFLSGIDLGYASVSKSSKSASVNSSSTTDVKTSGALIDPSDVSLHDHNKNNGAMAALSGTSPIVESSFCSGEPLLGLKLGKPIYFEDAYEGSSQKTLDVPLVEKSSGIPAKRLRSTAQSTLGPRCQVLGCNLDLSSAKGYHRKHKVCESHSKCPKVIVNGFERRFCQQCSRFHGLSEFDEKKRSCRKRLSDHNARRRKPQPDLVQLNPACMPTLFYGMTSGGLRQVNSALGKVSLAPRPDRALAWANSSSFEVMQRRDNVLNSKYPMAAPVDEQPHVLNDGVSGSIKPLDAVSQGSCGLLSFKNFERATFGSGERMISFALDGPGDVHRALSLLSTTDSREHLRPKSGACGHPFATTNDVAAIRVDLQPMPSIGQSPVVAATGYWQAERPDRSEANIMNPPTGDISNNNPDFFLLNARHDFRFDSI